MQALLAVRSDQLAGHAEELACDSKVSVKPTAWVLAATNRPVSKLPIKPELDRNHRIIDGV